MTWPAVTYTYTSLCGCLKVKYPIAIASKELAKKFCRVMKTHYLKSPKCLDKAYQDPVWQERKNSPKL